MKSYGICANLQSTFLFGFRFEETDGSIRTTCEQNFGQSLLAAYTDHYLSDFVLHGTSDTNFHSRLHNDLRMTVQVCRNTVMLMIG